MKDGLPHSQILCIYQDATGYIWSGTMGGGVSKFNGNTFQNFDIENGLTNSIVRAITQDSSGRMWFGTMGGGLHYLQNDSIYSFNDSLIDKTVYSLFTDYKGQIWVGHGLGVSVINNMKVENLLPELPKYAVTHIMGDSKNNVWFNYNDNYGIYKYNKKELVHIDSTQGLTPSTILFIYEDSRNTIWAGTAVGLYSFSSTESNPKVILHGNKEGIPEEFTFDITEDRFGNLIIGTHKNGFIRWDRKTNEKTIVNHQKGILADNVFRTYTDRENIVWLSAYGKGLTRFNDALFTQHSKKEGITNNIVSGIVIQGDSTWVATSTGIFLGINNVFSAPYKKQLNSSISAIHKDNKNRIWFTGENSIGFIKNNKITMLDPLHQSIKFGKDLAEDSQGNIYIATWGDGIWKYTDKLNQIPSPDSIVLSHTYGISIDKADNIWIGTFGYGALKIENNNATIHSTNIGVLSDKVFTVAEGKNNTFYLGTNGGGLSIIKDGKLIKNITKSDGLLHNSILSILVNNNEVWCGSVKGLSKITFANNTDFSIKNYGTWVGFNFECMHSSIAKSENEDILIGTNKGLVVYNKNEDKPLLIKPGININSILLDYGETDITKHCEKINEVNGLPLNLVLPYAVKRISFNFEGVCMNYSDELAYSYRLRGMDNEFSPFSKNNEVTYHNLQAGNYIFEVLADAHGTSSTVSSFKFTVLKPFWKTFWFIGLCILFCLLSVIFFVRWRTNKLRKSKLLLENTVRTRTSELRTQKHIVEEKNKEILDSITYAKRIQSAILPPLKIVKSYLQESFILYKPKDIVAGDFYWMESVTPADNQKEAKVLFAAADCTGHGVPGAMVSVVCNNALNRSVREYGLTDPGEILTKTRDIVIEEFEKSEEDVHDGMDIALCSLSGNILKYAGAHNPLWIVRKQSDKENETLNGKIVNTFSHEDYNYNLFEIKANKQPIGKFDNPTPYTSHTFELQKGDTIYIFSDGYVDQFGGEKGKKFKARSFRELLLSIQENSLEQQKEIINSTFETWRGNLEQIDDVCVIGVRIE